MNRPRTGHGRWAAPNRRDERGSVTAELAVAMPVLVLLLLAGLAAVNAVATKLRCVDAAREAARAQARGDEGLSAGRRAAPDGAVVTVDGHGEVVRATVRAVVHPLGGRLPGIGIEAFAVAAREPEPEAAGGPDPVAARGPGAVP